MKYLKKNKMNKESLKLFVSQQQNEINGTCFLTQCGAASLTGQSLASTTTQIERPAQIRFGNHFAKMCYDVCFVFYNTPEETYKINEKTYKIVNMIHHRSETKIILDVRFSGDDFSNFSNIVEFHYNGYQNVNWMNLQKEMFCCK